jgi:hypothetical protein
MLNVRNLLYRPSLILLGRLDYAGENGLDLSTTLTCARFCVASAKDTIQLLHKTSSRLTGAFWYNIFCDLFLMVSNSRYLYCGNCPSWRSFMFKERRRSRYRRRLESCNRILETHLFQIHLRRTLSKSIRSHAFSIKYILHISTNNRCIS